MLKNWILAGARCISELVDLFLTLSALDISAGIFKQSMGARNRLGIMLSDRPARLHMLAELNPWNRFLGSLKV
jgi:hypothetical protein